MSTTGPCTETAALLHDYLEDLLAPDARRDLERHLHDCDGCTRELHELRSTRQLLQRMPRRPMPVHLKDALLDAMKKPPRPDDSDRGGAA